MEEEVKQKIPGNKECKDKKAALAKKLKPNKIEQIRKGVLNGRELSIQCHTMVQHLTMGEWKIHSYPQEYHQERFKCTTGPSSSSDRASKTYAKGKRNSLDS